MSHTILCVDDDANILAGIQRNLRKQFSLDTALGGEQGLAKLKEHGPYAVVVADMQMPGMNGLQFLVAAERLAPDTVRLMLTGNSDQKTAMDAVNQGHVFRFLTKPCPPDNFALALEAGLKQHRLITAERELLENTLNGALRVVTDVLATMDPASFALGERLRDFMRTYARHYNVAQSWALEMAAMLSQVGYVAVPASVLMKSRAGLTLKPEEKDMLLRVPRTGADLLEKIPRLDPVAKIVLYQNKHFDGSGFPLDDVSGDDIPIGARILKILADLIDLEAKRHSRLLALAKMRTRAGWYDPAVLDSVSACFDTCLPPTFDQEATVREVSLKNLTVGLVLAANAETCDGTPIITAGTLVSPMLLEKLRNFDQLNILKQPLLVQERARFEPGGISPPGTVAAGKSVG